MLKRRIIPIELLSGNRLIKTRAFGDARDVGDPVKSSKVYSDQDADELILLQIDREDRDFGVLVATVEAIAEQCFVPFTVGGGISTVADAARLFFAGADKVVVNSAAYADYGLISEICHSYGSQAIVAGIDVKLTDGKYVLHSNCGRKAETCSIEEHITNLVEAGAGELFVQRIDFDGKMQGYDNDLLKMVLQICPLPVITAAGAGNFMHLKDAFELGASAAACGSLFNFGDNNPLRAKAFLKNYGIPLKRI